MGNRQLIGLQRFLAWVGLGGMTVVFGIATIVRLVQRDYGWAAIAVVLTVVFALWLRREVRGKGAKLGRALLVALPLTLATAVGTSDTTLAACSTPGTHWHWRSATDKFRSEKRWTSCWSTANGADGGCTSWYDAYNYAYICSVNIGGHCTWQYTGKISNHHTHRCIW